MKPKALFEALDFRVSELVKWDLLVGLAGGAGALWVALVHPELIDGLLPAVLGIVGLLIGAVVAAAAILAAFLDQAFLRKLKLIRREPVRYFAPFLFTAFLGVVASLLLLVLTATPSSAPEWVRATLAALGGLCSFWTVASLVYDLDILVQFLQLQDAAADVPDEGEGQGEVRSISK